MARKDAAERKVIPRDPSLFARAGRTPFRPCKLAAKGKLFPGLSLLRTPCSLVDISIIRPEQSSLQKFPAASLPL